MYCRGFACEIYIIILIISTINVSQNTRTHLDLEKMHAFRIIIQNCICAEHKHECIIEKNPEKCFEWNHLMRSILLTEYINFIQLIKQLRVS